MNYFTVKDSFKLAREMSQVKNNQFHIAGFDIKSLFTNIPIRETCNIILEKLFLLPYSVFDGFTRATFSKTQNLCTKNNLFIFNNQLYIHLDDTPMAGFISPTLSNIFLSQ